MTITLRQTKGSRLTHAEADANITSFQDTSVVTNGDALIGVKLESVGSLARTQHKKNEDRISDKDHGSIVDDSTDDTTSLQLAITREAETYGRELLLPAKIRQVTALTIPGTQGQQVSLKGDPQTYIKAKAGATTLVKLSGDISRTGFREIKSLKINGNNVANVVGLQSGDTTSACLQVYMRSLDVSRCETGIDLYSAMENSCTDVIAYLNTVGLKLRQDATNGGGNANRFDGLRLQQNTVGLFLYGASSFPMQNNQFNQTLVQSNTLCGIAMFDIDDGFQFNAMHFEDNATAGTTLAVNGKTVQKCAIQMDNSAATFAESVFAEATANPLIILQNGATIRLRNSGGYGLSGGVFVSGTLAETVEFYGNFTAPALVRAHVARWPDTLNVSGGVFTAIGTVVLTPTVRITNDIATIPTVPLLQNAADATINADSGDAQMGMVSSVTYAALAGSTSTNRVVIDALPTGVTNGDTWVLTFLVKCSASSLMNFVVTDGSYATFSDCPVDTKWRRVVIAFKAGSTNTPLLYCYPTNNDARTVTFAKLQSLRVPSGGDLASISETVSLGLFNNNQNEFSYSAAPTVGTWKRGDRVWFYAPSAGGAPGAICTTAGTPGTWKAMASLAA